MATAKVCPQCNQLVVMKTKNKPEEEWKWDTKKKMKVKVKNKQYKYYCAFCGYKFKDDD